MIEAVDWVCTLNVIGGQEQAIRSIRRIQADALRWAANMSGSTYRWYVLTKADELDPPPEKNPL